MIYKRTLDVYETGIIFNSTSSSKTKDIHSHTCIILAKTLGTLTTCFLHTDDLSVLRTSRIVEFEKYYISFKSLYDSTSASVCS